MMKKQNQVVFYAIKGSTIKKFLLIDCITGTSSYFVFKIATSSILIGMVGSIACTEGLKSSLSKLNKQKNMLY